MIKKGSSLQCLQIANLPSSLPFVEVNVDSLQLKFVISDVRSGGVNAVLSGHDLQNNTRSIDKKLKRSKNIKVNDYPGAMMYREEACRMQTDPTSDAPNDSISMPIVD